MTSSIGQRVPPSPKPKMCREKDGIGACKRQAIKGKALCAQHEFEAEDRTARAQAAAQEAAEKK